MLAGTKWLFCGASLIKLSENIPVPVLRKGVRECCQEEKKGRGSGLRSPQRRSEGPGQGSTQLALVPVTACSCLEMQRCLLEGTRTYGSAFVREERRLRRKSILLIVNWPFSALRSLRCIRERPSYKPVLPGVTGSQGQAEVSPSSHLLPCTGWHSQHPTFCLRGENYDSNKWESPASAPGAWTGSTGWGEGCAD